MKPRPAPPPAATDALQALQADVAAALLDPSRPPPPGLQSWNGACVAQRFGIHRNNVLVSLVDALADAYPVLAEVVGPDFFGALATDYVRAHPPRGPVLAEWGEHPDDDFAAWLQAWLPARAPAAGLPWLPDLARLERARQRAWHAADAEPVPPATLAAALARPQQLPAARLRLHPALSALASTHAVVSLWQLHQGAQADAQALAALDIAQAEAALVLREGDLVLVRPVPAAEAGFVAALAAGRSLGEAAADAGPALDLAAALARLIGAGALVGWTAPGGPVGAPDEAGAARAPTRARARAEPAA